MVNELMVELSRWQFAATSLYHFLFVPLTLGISWLVFIMELVYVSTGKVIYRDMAKFWGKLFGINFAIGVATGITLEFEFGTNWSNYSHYVGDIFGAPLAIEGLMAFFLESTFIGLMFTGWKRFSKKTHLVITFLTALGSNLSAMWILIANGWMQYPEFAQFSAERMRMEMVDFWGLVFSDVAQAKFLHTVTAGYITASVFVIGVSAFLMLQRKSLQFAKRSMTIAIVFCLAAMGASGLSGDISAIKVTEHQPAKLAAMEAEFHTQEPPAAWSLFAIPNESEMDNYFSIKIPALLGIIATHSIDTEVKGLRDIVKENEVRVRNGLIAHRALQQLRSGEVTEENKATFEAHKDDLGYGLLLVEHAADPLNPSEDEIKAAARNSVPPVTITYFAFRVMIGVISVLGLLIAGAAFFLWYKRDLHTRTKLLKILVLSIPLPFIACEAGWIVAEVGRQPWAIQDILPTFLATSSLSPLDVGLSFVCFIGIYTLLLVIEMKLMIKAIKQGPDLTDPEPEGKGYPPLAVAPVAVDAVAQVEDKAQNTNCDCEKSECSSETKVEEKTCDCENGKCESEAKVEEKTCDCEKSECESEAKAEEKTCDCENGKCESEAKVEEKTCDCEKSECSEPEVKAEDKPCECAQEAKEEVQPQETTVKEEDTKEAKEEESVAAKPKKAQRTPRKVQTKKNSTESKSE